MYGLREMTKYEFLISVSDGCTQMATAYKKMAGYQASYICQKMKSEKLKNMADNLTLKQASECL